MNPTTKKIVCTNYTYRILHTELINSTKPAALPRVPSAHGKKAESLVNMKSTRRCCFCNEYMTNLFDFATCLLLFITTAYI